MNITLNFQSDIPLYEQLIVQIKRLIMNGSLRQGDQLPTMRALAVDLGINFNTVARAYRSLDAEGFISTQHGRGTFVLGFRDKKKMIKLRKDAFMNLTQKYLSESATLGYTIEEIKKMFYEHLSSLEEK